MLIQHSPRVWTVKNFLNASTCDDVILYGETSGFEEATVGMPNGVQMLKCLRDNYRVVFHDLKMAQTFFQNLQLHLPKLGDGSIPIAVHDEFRVYRYEDGQRFKRHIDGRIKRELGDSRLSFLIYLNDDFSGGETKFDDVTITPQKGSALLFVHEQKHEGCPVENGAKYVLRTDVIYTQGNTHIRER